MRRMRSGDETNSDPLQRGKDKYTPWASWILLNAKPLKLLAGLQQIGGVLSWPVKV